MEKEIQDLIAELKKITGTNQTRARALETELKMLKAKVPFTTEERRLLIDKLSSTKELLKKEKKQTEGLDKLIESQRDLVKANDDVVEGLRKVGNSFVGIGKAAFEGSGSISAFTDNVLGFKTLGNRLDVNIETFRQLSQTGANFGQSIVQLRTAAAEAALPLDDFAALVANNSQNLAALFGSTTQGARAIASLGREVRAVGIESLAPLGFTVDEINETLLLNLESQRRTGVLDRLTNDQRRDSAISFAVQLDRLAKLTGIQRQELASTLESQKSNERFQIALQGQTEETRQRLQLFAGAVEKIGPGFATGVQDLIANAGVPVTEAARQVVFNVPQLQGIIKNLLNGSASAEEALVAFGGQGQDSIERFSKATVTGTVGFTNLQGDLVNISNAFRDLDAVNKELNGGTTSLTSNLTSFEQASKVLSSQFQAIETGLLSAFGPALGRLIGGIQEIFTGGGKIATMLKDSPALTAGLFAGALTGKFIFNKAAQIGIIAAGTRLGTAHIAGSSTMASLGKTGMKGGLRTAGGVGLMAGGTGIAATAESNAGKAAGLAMSTAGGALTGATIGSVIPLVGTLAGAIIGGAIGLTSGVLGMQSNQTPGRQFGGGMDGGKTYLVGERGPEMITAGTKSTVTANSDLKSTFDTSSLETKMASLVTEMNSANKTLSNMVNGVNTLVAVESRALKAVEKTARKDTNQIGLV